MLRRLRLSIGRKKLGDTPDDSFGDQTSTSPANSKKENVLKKICNHLTIKSKGKGSSEINNLSCQNEEALQNSPSHSPTTLSINRCNLNNNAMECTPIEQPHAYDQLDSFSGFDDFDRTALSESGEPCLSLGDELLRLSRCGWYWGPISRAEAEEKLKNQPEGAFLVRDSSDERYLFSLSFNCYQKTLHTRIEYRNGRFSFFAQEKTGSYSSVVELIEASVCNSLSGVFCYLRCRNEDEPSFPVQLTYPVSRFTQVRSLQYLCRFVIRQNTRIDNIQKLPLPSQIKGYVEEGAY